MKSFRFYEEYYQLIDNLKRKDKLLLLEAIVDYVFKGEENNLKGMNKAIFDNLKRPLNKSKNRSDSVNKRWNNNCIQNDIQTDIQNDIQNEYKTNTHNMSLLYVNNNSLENNKGVIGGKEETFVKNLSIYDFVQEKGITLHGTPEEQNTLLIWKEIDREILLECIEESLRKNINSVNYVHGILKNKLKKQSREKLPEWFYADVEKQELTEEEQQKLEEILKKY